MFIDVGEIRKSPGKTFQFELQQEIEPLSIGTDEVNFKDPVKISLNIKNTGKVLVFNGHITADTELVCSRCLEKYPYHLDYSFAEEFCHSSDVADVSDDGLDTTDMHVFEGNRIEMDELILENVVLAIPMKSVCSEDCRGLCSICGTNLNKKECNCETETIDPRLGVLKKFFEQ